MDGRRTCLVVGLVVVGVAAGGTVASAVPDNDSGNHFGQLKHQTTPPDTTPTETTPPPGPVITPPSTPTTSTTATATATAPSTNSPPATETEPAPAVPSVIPGTVDKSLALPPLPKSGDIPPV